MSFQSILSPREGWKSQKLLARICHNCLSTPVVMRRLTSTAATAPLAQTPRPSLFDNFKHELYQSYSRQLDPKHSLYEAPVRKTIHRRESRKRLMHWYRLLKQQQPALLAQLTQQDLERFINHFASAHHPDDPNAQTSLLQALHILEDLKKGNLFQKAQFRAQEAERMISLASTLNLWKRAESLLHEIAIEQRADVSLSAYEAVIDVLARQKKYKRVQFWLEHLADKHMDPSRSIVRTVVLCRLEQHQLEDAIAYLRRHASGKDLVDLVTRYADADQGRTLLDHALTRFAIDSMDQWRLNAARSIYLIKHSLGMNTMSVLRSLVTNSLYTYQTGTAQSILEDTIRCKDRAGTQLCLERIMERYLARKDIKHAVDLWQQMEQKSIPLLPDVFESLIRHAAKLKYHVDTMRLYTRYRELYPRMNLEMPVIVLRCMTDSRQFDSAQQIAPQVESILPRLNRSLARKAALTLFKISSQTGQVDLFERVFKASETLELNLTHQGLTSLVACYLHRGDIPAAKAAFQKIATYTDGPDVVDFNLLMRITMMDEGGIANQDKIFEILSHMKLVDVSPDETTLRTMLDFYEDNSEMQNNLFSKLLENAVSHSEQVFINNIALTYHLKRTDIRRVVDIICRNNRGALFPSQEGKPIARDGLTYQILLDFMAGESNYTSMVEKLIKDMDARGLKPPQRVYEKLIEALAKKPKLSKARRYIAKMKTDLGAKPNLSLYTKLVDNLMIRNAPHLAKEVIKIDMVKDEVKPDHNLKNKLKTIESLLSSSSH
ncbi:hypothetical protein BD560DRAFT_382836 [Blakeslea trispora]|nr:hypothetical protein BD560DRAFT_382836 [Blakeslea trispora]